ncbi:hypothetical protein MMC30_007760 [Trapelia coarctata]|nr:hypothetical protein [Trapelia coarctata]
MADRAMQHRRTHNLLLFQRLLALREGSSPFTLILDSLEQSGRLLILEYIRRAKTTKTTVIFIAFETLTPPSGIDILIKARRKDVTVLQKEISQSVSKSTPTILILDTLHSLLSSPNPNFNLPSFLSSFLSPSTSLLALYHTDISIPTSPNPNPYAPPPLPLLKYLATTIFTTHSLSQVLARKRAAEKSLAEPMFGLAEEIEGVIIGRGANDRRGVVLEMEHRRKSGRSVGEWFFLPSSAQGMATGPGKAMEKGRERERVILLDDHPLYKTPSSGDGIASESGNATGDDAITFSLGLTEKQRRDREGVVLPYFDAQKEGGGGGGRILYDMGDEDDFDEEEDEI